MFLVAAAAEEEQILQDDPCLAKNKIAGDVQYCDRYWECEFGQPELYDCPNGLVWIGRNQGIADGCDYPWRHPNICKNKDLASKYLYSSIPEGALVSGNKDIVLRIRIVRCASCSDSSLLKCPPAVQDVGTRQFKPRPGLSRL